MEALLRVRDLTMLQAHHAHERSRAEWKLPGKVHTAEDQADYTAF